MEEAHLKFLKKLRDTYRELVKIHEDTSFLNKEAPEYTRVLKRFLELQEDIFLFKNLWYELEQID